MLGPHVESAAGGAYSVRDPCPQGVRRAPRAAGALQRTMKGDHLLNAVLRGLCCHHHDRHLPVMLLLWARTGRGGAGGTPRKTRPLPVLGSPGRRQAGGGNDLMGYSWRPGGAAQQEGLGALNVLAPQFSSSVK